MVCKFCEQDVVVVELTAHEKMCGNRTEQCVYCKDWISLKDWDSHQSRFHGFSSKRFRERSVVRTAIPGEPGVGGMLLKFFRSCSSMCTSHIL